MRDPLAPSDQPEKPHPTPPTPPALRVPCRGPNVPPHYCQALEAAKIPENLWPPHGRNAVHDFADFQPALDVTASGELEARFELKNIVRLDLPAGRTCTFAGTAIAITRIAVHHKAAPFLAAALSEISAEDLWQPIYLYGGGFCPRLIRGGSSLSMHALGLAVDFDPANNPLGAPPNKCAFGSTESGQKVVKIFERWGWFWGGRFRQRPDCQHFQFVTGA